MMLTFYQLEWCPSCHLVRQVMTELRLNYMTVNVPFKREERAEVMSVSGQDGVPVLKDGDRVLTETGSIVEYLRSTFPDPGDAEEHAVMGEWRFTTQLSVSPQATLTRLKSLLGEHGFEIAAEIRGNRMSEDLSQEYILLEALLPEAALKAIEADALAPAALLLPLAVIPTAEGGSVVSAADPISLVWLYADAPLRKAQWIVKNHLIEILEAL
jgi:glutathione S-transferase